MPYEFAIEKRIDEMTRSWANLDKKKMFGGICYLLNGNMCFGIYKDFLIVRAGKDLADSMLGKEHIKPFDITGRPMKGWFMVNQDGFARDEALSEFLEIGKNFATTLPSK